MKKIFLTFLLIFLCFCEGCRHEGTMSSSVAEPTSAPAAIASAEFSPALPADTAPAPSSGLLPYATPVSSPGLLPHATPTPSSGLLPHAAPAPSAQSAATATPTPSPSPASASFQCLADYRCEITVPHVHTSDSALYSIYGWTGYSPHDNGRTGEGYFLNKDPELFLPHLNGKGVFETGELKDARSLLVKIATDLIKSRGTELFLYEKYFNPACLDQARQIDWSILDDSWKLNEYAFDPYAYDVTANGQEYYTYGLDLENKQIIEPGEHNYRFSFVFWPDIMAMDVESSAWLDVSLVVNGVDGKIQDFSVYFGDFTGSDAATEELWFMRRYRKWQIMTPLSELKLEEGLGKGVLISEYQGICAGLLSEIIRDMHKNIGVSSEKYRDYFSDTWEFSASVRYIGPYHGENIWQEFGPLEDKFQIRLDYLFNETDYYTFSVILIPKEITGGDIMEATIEVNRSTGLIDTVEICQTFNLLTELSKFYGTYLAEVY